MCFRFAFSIENRTIRIPIKTNTVKRKKLHTYSDVENVLTILPLSLSSKVNMYKKNGVIRERKMCKNKNV